MNEVDNILKEIDDLFNNAVDISNSGNADVLGILSKLLLIVRRIRTKQIEQNDDLNTDVFTNINRIDIKMNSLIADSADKYKIIEDKFQSLDKMIELLNDKLNEKYVSHPVLQQVIDKIGSLENMVKKRDGIESGDNLFSPTLILISEIKEKIIEKKRVTGDQLDELNKIYKTLRRP